MRFDPDITQVMRQLVGPVIQLAITQADIAMHHSDCFRRKFDLHFEQPMNGLFHRVIQRGGIEVDNQLSAFLLRQDRQAVQGRLRGMLKCFHQALQRRLHVVADTLRTDVDNGLGVERKVLTEIVHVQSQRVVAPFLRAQALNTRPCGTGLRTQGFAATVPVVE
ncbi:hypothetical protein ALQ96_04150, partial [Pseudomonas syringae pv. atrofaciens]